MGLGYNLQSDKCTLRLGDSENFCIFYVYIAIINLHYYLIFQLILIYIKQALEFQTTISPQLSCLKAYIALEPHLCLM